MKVGLLSVKRECGQENKPSVLASLQIAAGTRLKYFMKIEVCPNIRNLSRSKHLFIASADAHYYKIAEILKQIKL
jgi:hypothetical protein